MDEKENKSSRECASSETEDNQHNQVYSAFSRGEKRWIVFLVAYAGLFSPLSSFIYYPGLVPLAEDLDITLEKANLSITSYMIVSGVVPSLLGDMAESLGRRPLYLGSILIYTLANVGLAIQESYPALIILRMLQSAGSSGELSVHLERRTIQDTDMRKPGRDHLFRICGSQRYFHTRRTRSIRGSCASRVCIPSLSNFVEASD